MIKWLCGWITRQGGAYNMERAAEGMTQPLGGVRRARGTFPVETDGMHFHLHDAENGKVLRVYKTEQQNQHMNPPEKVYIIPEGANLIEFITRALVEERIK